MWSHSWAFHKSESVRVLSVATYLCCILWGANNDVSNKKGMWTQEFILLAWQTLKAKSPKSLTSSAKINCHANLWIRGLPASVATQPLETRLVLLKGYLSLIWNNTIRPFFWGGGGGGDLTIEEWSLDAYHELVPVDLKSLRSSMLLLGFARISSFSIMYLSLPILLLWNKHSSGKIKNSKQRPLEQRIPDPHRYIHRGGRIARQSIKNAFSTTVFLFVLLTVWLEGQ